MTLYLTFHAFVCYTCTLILYCISEPSFTAHIILGKWHLGLSCNAVGDYCHHPNKHGIDYFFGIPLTNLRNMGDDSDVFTALRPEVPRTMLITGLIMFISIFVTTRFIGRCVAVMMVIIFSVFVIFTIYLFAGMHIWNGMLMRNYEIVEQPYALHGNMAERLAKEGIRFLEKQSQEKPFLLFMSWLQVHTALHASNRFKGNLPI